MLDLNVSPPTRLIRFGLCSLLPCRIRLSACSLVRLTTCPPYSSRSVLVTALPYTPFNHGLINRFLAATCLVSSCNIGSWCCCGGLYTGGCVGEGGRGESMMVTFVTKRPQKISTHLFPHALTATHESSSSIPIPMLSFLKRSKIMILQGFGQVGRPSRNLISLWSIVFLHTNNMPIRILKSSQGATHIYYWDKLLTKDV